MVACLSPSDTNYEESLSTLKFAHNTKFINIKPIVNEQIDPKDELIRELQGEIKFLRDRLREQNQYFETCLDHENEIHILES